MPLVSVVIPVFNGEKTIEETIRSVLAQSLTDFEVLVIDDGSQDQTAAIVTSIKDSRIQLHHYPNKGLSASRNRGIHRAVGKYISFLDADDLWTPEKLEAQLQAMGDHPNATVAYSWTDYIDGNSRIFQAGSRVTANGQVLERLLLRNFVESGSNILVLRSVFEQVGDFDETLKAAEDWDMLLRLAVDHPFVCVPAPHVQYRRTNSMSSNVIRQERECLKVIDRAFEKAPDNLQALKGKSLANLYQYLTFKALEGPPGRRKGVDAARCLWLTMRHNPALLKQPKVVLSVALKIVMTVMMPASFSEKMLNRSRSSQ